MEKYGGVTAEGIVESALDKVRMIEEMGYDNLPPLNSAVRPRM